MRQKNPYVVIAILVFVIGGMVLAEFNFFSPPVERQAFASLPTDSPYRAWYVYEVSPCFEQSVTKEGLPGTYNDKFCPGTWRVAVPHPDSLAAWVKPPAFAIDAELLSLGITRLIYQPQVETERNNDPPADDEPSGPVKPFPKN